MPSRRINLAFVGSGAWARRYHFPAIGYLSAGAGAAELPGVELALRGIFSLEPEVATRVAAKAGFDCVYPSLEALVDDKAVDAVAVAVTPSASMSVVSALAPKGVPILSEKPPGITASEAQALSDTVTVPNLVAFNRRFAPLNNTFKAMADALDDVYYVEGHFYRHERFEESFIVGTGIHWINFMEYISGPIERVHADVFANPSDETHNYLAQFTFEDGLRGRLNVFQSSGAQVERLAVHSPRCTLMLHGPLWAEPGCIYVHAGAKVTEITSEARTPLPEIVRLGIVAEYVEFITQACRGLPTRSNFQNAANSMRVAEAIACVKP